jgi:phosphohistidine phosphatase
VKRLTIMRHAKSSWDDPRHQDFDRPLNDRGWAAARRMGREMEALGMTFDLVIASPAARVRQTIDGLAETLLIDGDIRFEPAMYGASDEALLQIVRGIAEGVKTPLLIGHNPGLQNLAVELTGDESVRRKFPTAALAQIDLHVERWSEANPGSGKIARLILPKELD